MVQNGYCCCFRKGKGEQKKHFTIACKNIFRTSTNRQRTVQPCGSRIHRSAEGSPRAGLHRLQDNCSRTRYQAVNNKRPQPYAAFHLVWLVLRAKKKSTNAQTELKRHVDQLRPITLLHRKKWKRLRR